MPDETITNMAAAYLSAKQARQSGASWLDSTLQGVIGAAGMEKAAADPLFKYKKEEAGQTIEMNALKLVEAREQRELQLKQQKGLNDVLTALSDATSSGTLGDPAVTHSLLEMGAKAGLGNNATFMQYLTTAARAEQTRNLLSVRSNIAAASRDAALQRTEMQQKGALQRTELQQGQATERKQMEIDARTQARMAAADTSGELITRTDDRGERYYYTNKTWKRIPKAAEPYANYWLNWAKNAAKDETDATRAKVIWDTAAKHIEQATPSPIPRREVRTAPAAAPPSNELHYDAQGNLIP